MNELLQAVISWKTLVAALLVFGLLPGVCLRLIVLLYPKESDVRHELIGELYHLPRWERPFWVAEQLETALFEGLLPRRSVRRVYRTARIALNVTLALSTGLLGFLGALCGLAVARLCNWPTLLPTIAGAMAVDLIAAVVIGRMIFAAAVRPYMPAYELVAMASRLAGLPGSVVGTFAIFWFPRTPRRESRCLQATRQARSGRLE